MSLSYIKIYKNQYFSYIICCLTKASIFMSHSTACAQPLRPTNRALVNKLIKCSLLLKKGYFKSNFILYYFKQIFLKIYFHKKIFDVYYYLLYKTSVFLIKYIRQKKREISLLIDNKKKWNENLFININKISLFMRYFIDYIINSCHNSVCNWIAILSLIIFNSCNSLTKS